MHLTITTALLRELAHAADQCRRPDDTAIVITPGGLDVMVRTGSSHHDYREVFNASWLTHHFLPANPTPDTEGDTPPPLLADLDYDDPDAVANVMDGMEWAITDEYGNTTTPGRTVEAVVVQNDTDAYWIDRGQARVIIDTFGADEDTTERLWLTHGGNYVIERDTPLGGRHTVWCVIDPEEAALMAYDFARSDPARLNPATPLLAAAVAAARIVDTVTATAATDPAAAVAVGGILAELLRGNTLPDIRDARAAATRTVTGDNDGDMAAVLWELRRHRTISRATVESLLTHAAT